MNSNFNCAKTVLVVDDEMRHLQGMRRLILRLKPGWNVYTAPSAAEALMLFEKDPADLIISDIKMDDMDGLELVAKIRNRNRNVHIVIVSAYDYFWYAKKAIQVGVEDYLLKPIDEKELLNVLNRLDGKGDVERSISSESQTPTFNMDNELIVRLTEYIDKHYGEDLSLETIADAFHFSPAYISSFFKQKLGIGYLQYLREVRLKKAQKLLRTSGMKVQEIADKVGFHDAGYFIRIFKQECGITPDDYRKRG